MGTILRHMALEGAQRRGKDTTRYRDTNIRTWFASLTHSHMVNISRSGTPLHSYGPLGLAAFFRSTRLQRYITTKPIAIQQMASFGSIRASAHGTTIPGAAHTLCWGFKWPKIWLIRRCGTSSCGDPKLRIPFDHDIFAYHQSSGSTQSVKTYRTYPGFPQRRIHPRK